MSVYCIIECCGDFVHSNKCIVRTLGCILIETADCCRAKISVLQLLWLIERDIALFFAPFRVELDEPKWAQQDANRIVKEYTIVDCPESERHWFSPTGMCLYGRIDKLSIDNK